MSERGTCAGDVAERQPARSFAVIVTGVPRSGTSLVMQMLAAGGLPVLTDTARPADADNPRGYFEYAPVRRLREDASWIGAARGRALKVVHALLTALPTGAVPYRVISVHRDWQEVAASQRAMLARAGAAADGLSDARAMAVQHAQRDAAERWLEGREGFALLRVDHAEILRDPPGAAATLGGFAGGGLDLAAMAACVDPSLHRQRRAAIGEGGSGSPRASRP